MTQALGTLSIDLVARLAKLQAGLDEAGRLNAKTTASIEARWKALGSIGTSFAAGLVGAFSVGTIATFTRSTINAIDALNDAKDATGATIENLSALENIARRNGGTMDTVTGVLVKFNNVLKEADGKNGVSKALEAIGLNAAELRRMDPALALQATAQALSRFADDGDKARLVQELFGKSIREAAPFLKDLAEAGQLNATVTTAQAEAAERFNKNMAAMQSGAANLGRSLISELLPSINALVSRLNIASESFGGFFSGLAGSLMGPAQFKTLGAVREEIGRVEKSMAAYNGQNGAIGDWSVNQAKQQLSYLRQLETYYTSIVKMRNANTGQDDPTELARRGRGPATLPILPDLAGLTGTKTPRPARPAAPQLNTPQQLPQGLADAIAALEATDVAKIDRLKASIQALRDLMSTPGGGGAYADEALADLQDQMARLLPTGPDIPPELLAQRDALSDANKRLAESIRQLHESTPEGAAARLRGMLAAVQAFQPASGQQATERESAIALLQRQLQDLQKTGVDVGANLSAALGDSLGMALRGNFEGIAQSWQNMLLDMVAQAAKADLMAALTGKGAGGNLFGLVGGFGKFFGIPGFASGGSHTGGVRMVGERGPELEFTGPSQILDAQATRRALGSGRSAGRTGPQYTIHVAAGMGRAEVYEAVQMGVRAAQADARQLMRTNNRAGG